MAHVLLRAGPVERRGVQQRRVEGIFAVVRWRLRNRVVDAVGRGVAVQRNVGDDGQRLPIGDDFLELLGGVLAAGRALRQILIRAAGDRLGVRLAQVAARTAIELRHRRHQHALDRLAVGELHPLAERNTGVVPGECLLFDGRRQRTIRAVRRLIRAVAGVQVEDAGEEAVEPRTLRATERRAFGEERDRHTRPFTRSPEWCSRTTPLILRCHARARSR